MPSEVIAAIAVALVTAAGGVIVAFLELIGRLREIAANGREVKAQVRNSHGTNLRDDLDAFRDEWRESARVIREDARAEHNALWHAITGRRELPTEPTMIVRPESKTDGQTRQARDP